MQSRRPATAAGGRAAAIALIVAVFAGIASSASADTNSRLERARSQLAALSAQAKSEVATLARVQNQMGVMQNKVDAARARAESTAATLTQVQAQLQQAQADYDSLQGRLDALARDAYMQGPGSGIEAILGASSLSDLNDRVEYVQAISQNDATLAHQAAGLAASLSQQQADLDGLLASRSQALTEIASQQEQLNTVLEQQQAAVDALNATRDRVVSLIASLQATLRAQALSQFGVTFQGSGGHATYGNWAGMFLQTMGAPTCHSNLVVVVAWQVSEGTQAAWNPLATTYDMPGATPFNSAGVKNYASLQQGLDATRLTIVNGAPAYHYGPIVSNLKACSDPAATAQAINASSWCRGCAGGHYVTGNVAAVEANYDTYAAL
ncbi:MAG TPA: hypothetical protein VGH10_07355 [Actinomycetota bacterium]|jgi:peptidoglycan hydrolase CwlO-like protein